MARRKSSYTRRKSSGSSDGYSRSKSYGEARIERITWVFLILVIAIVQILQQGGMAVPNWSIPFVGSVVLLGSGMYQYSRRWRVSPTTWLAGALLAGLALVNLYVSPNSSFLGISLIVFAAVIVVGLLTGET